MALLCGTSADKSQILYAELCSSLSVLTCGRYCRPETPVRFLSYLSAYFFCSHVSLYLCGIPAGRYGTAIHARLYQALIFLLLLLPPCILCLRHFFASKYNMLNFSKKRIFLRANMLQKTVWPFRQFAQKNGEQMLAGKST